MPSDYAIRALIPSVIGSSMLGREGRNIQRRCTCRDLRLLLWSLRPVPVGDDGDQKQQGHIAKRVKTALFSTSADLAGAAPSGSLTHPHPFRLEVAGWGTPRTRLKPQPASTKEQTARA